MSEQPLTAPRMVEFPLSEFHLRRALYAANRDVLWPIGLALTVSRDGDDYIRLYVTEWDFGDGRVEVIEDPEPDFDAEFERFAAERRAKMSDRDRAKSLASARAGVPGDEGLRAARDEYAGLSLPLGEARSWAQHERDTALYYMDRMLAASPAPAGLDEMRIALNHIAIGGREADAAIARAGLASPDSERLPPPSTLSAPSTEES